jgi:riboflavin synthase
MIVAGPASSSSFHQQHHRHRCKKTNNSKEIATASSPSSSSALSMFTGIVEEIGTVVALEEKNDMVLWDGSTGTGTILIVKAKTVLDGAYVGCSICVSGVCLTATALSEHEFTVGLAPETLRRTYLGHLQAGDAVNLERASEIGGRNSGHFVQGHVDGTGEIVDRWTEQDSLFFRIRVSTPALLLPYIVPKGFIAIDGTSLTVVEVDHETNTFTFMLIEYTQKKIVVGKKSVGDQVNIEVDVLAKYAEATLAPILPRLAAMEAKIVELEQKLAAMASKE